MTKTIYVAISMVCSIIIAFFVIMDHMQKITEILGPDFKIELIKLIIIATPNIPLIIFALIAFFKGDSVKLYCKILALWIFGPTLISENFFNLLDLKEYMPWLIALIISFWIIVAIEEVKERKKRNVTN